MLAFYPHFFMSGTEHVRFLEGAGDSTQCAHSWASTRLGVALSKALVFFLSLFGYLFFISLAVDGVCDDEPIAQKH